jgi:hypothetical protein
MGPGKLRGVGRLVLGMLALALLTSGQAPAQPAPGDGPAVCRIGLNIEDLYDLDLARETFGAVLWLWSLCPGGSQGPLETIVLRTALPGVQLGEVQSTPVDDGRLYQYRRIQGTFRHDWNMRRYPFDRHRLVTLLRAARLRGHAPPCAARRHDRVFLVQRGRAGSDAGSTPRSGYDARGSLGAARARRTTCGSTDGR